MAGEMRVTHITEDVEIVGSLKGVAPVELEGKIAGDLTSAGAVTVGAAAVARGQVAAEAVLVEGQVAGNIVAKDRVELKRTARVQGDLKARRLVVEEGATLVGKVEVNPAGGALGAEPAPLSAGMDETSRGAEERPRGFFGKR